MLPPDLLYYFDKDFKVYSMLKFSAKEYNFISIYLIDNKTEEVKF